MNARAGWVAGVLVAGVLVAGVVAGSACGCGGESPERGTTEPEPAASATLPHTIRFGVGETARLLDVRAQEMDTNVVEVVDPYEDDVVRFEVRPARTLLDEMFGETWRSQEELVFVCHDGYRAGVSVARLLRHRVWFAFARQDASFAIDKPVGGEVVRTELAPAYLVWDSLRDDVIRSEGDWGWPYQIVAVEYATVAERYARLTPPQVEGMAARVEPTDSTVGETTAVTDPAADAASVQRGFDAFRRYCTRCHAINGQGGTVGPELNYPANVTEYLKPEWLVRWIGDPQSVRHRTPMPGLPAGVPHRDETIADLVAYLTAMADRKLEPQDDGV